MSFKISLAAGLMALSSLPAMASDAMIMVQDAYARASTPSSKSGAIFMGLMNHAAEADRLISASTPAARSTQLHTHEEDANGVMKMLHVEEGFEIGAGETLMLKRGGNHVMLLGLTGPLEHGATVPLTLTFEKAGEITVEIPVDLTRKPAGHGGHGDHSGHRDHSGHNHDS